MTAKLIHDWQAASQGGAAPSCPTLTPRTLGQGGIKILCQGNGQHNAVLPAQHNRRINQGLKPTRMQIEQMHQGSGRQFATRREPTPSFPDELPPELQIRIELLA